MKHTPFLNVPYQYVEDVSVKFCQQLNIKQPLSLMLTAHGDKARQYSGLGEENNISYGKILLVYLLSYEYPWSQTVRQTESGWVSIEEWLIKQITQDGPVKQALDSLSRHEFRKEIDDQEFEIWIDGDLQYRCKREDIEKGGLWLIFDKEGQQVDRDRYSNDIFERAISGQYSKK